MWHRFTVKWCSVYYTVSILVVHKTYIRCKLNIISEFISIFISSYWSYYIEVSTCTINSFNIETKYMTYIKIESVKAHGDVLWLCMQICFLISVHVHTHTQTHTDTHTHTRTHAHKRTHAGTHMRAHTRTSTQIWACLHVSIYFCVCQAVGLFLGADPPWVEQVGWW